MKPKKKKAAPAGRKTARKTTKKTRRISRKLAGSLATLRDAAYEIVEHHTDEAVRGLDSTDPGVLLDLVATLDELHEAIGRCAAAEIEVFPPALRRTFRRWLRNIAAAEDIMQQVEGRWV